VLDVSFLDEYFASLDAESLDVVLGDRLAALQLLDLPGLVPRYSKKREGRQIKGNDERHSRAVIAGYAHLSRSLGMVV
jgi:hypothetical protein